MTSAAINQKILSQSANDDPAVLDTITLYLQEIGKYPLLNHAEEITLGKLISAGRTAKSQLENDNLSPTQIETFQQTIDAGLVARNKLMNANYRLVISVIKPFHKDPALFLDMIQEGNLGLMRAADKFDYTLGYRFSTYASWWVRQSISRALVSQSRIIRIPVYLNERIYKMKKAWNELAMDLGRDPTLAETAEAMGTDEKSLQILQKIIHNPTSLDAPVGENADGNLGDILEGDDSFNPVQEFCENDLRRRVQDLLLELDAKEARIIALRFGLRDGYAYTLREVGCKFNLTRERIRQIEVQALNKLRKPCRSDLLADFV